MPRNTTEFGKKFREMFNYTGKLTKECMGKELWNEYFKMKSRERTNSSEHIKAKEERKAERLKSALEQQQHRKDVGAYLKHYCDDFEKIENYEQAKSDNFKGWQLHHRLETHNSDGERRLVDIGFEELKALGMYYHRPAEELILMKMVEHRRLHLCGKPGNRRKL